jgi:hypothetical protein
MNRNFSAGTIWRVRLARAGGDLAIDRMGELLDEVPRREAKQVRGKVVSLGTLLFRAPKSPAPLGFRQPSKSPQHVFIVSRAIPSSNESPGAFAAALARDLERCVLANAVMARELAVA